MEKKSRCLLIIWQGKEIQFANKGELERQIPPIRKRFLYASDYAKASLQQIFTKEKLKTSAVFTADYFSNAILMNDGKLNFTLQAMPWHAQLSPLKTAVAIDANGDNLPDILLAGNYYENNIQMGRYDADYGTVLINEGNGKFGAESVNGLQIKGQVRHIAAIKIGQKQAYILVRNNDCAMVVQFENLVKKKK